MYFFIILIQFMLFKKGSAWRFVTRRSWFWAPAASRKSKQKEFI